MHSFFLRGYLLVHHCRVSVYVYIGMQEKANTYNIFFFLGLGGTHILFPPPNFLFLFFIIILYGAAERLSNLLSFPCHNLSLRSKPQSFCSTLEMSWFSCLAFWGPVLPPAVVIRMGFPAGRWRIPFHSRYIAGGFYLWSQENEWVLVSKHFNMLLQPCTKGAESQQISTYFPRVIYLARILLERYDDGGAEGRKRSFQNAVGFFFFFLLFDFKKVILLWNKSNRGVATGKGATFHSF